MISGLPILNGRRFHIMDIANVVLDIIARTVEAETCEDSKGWESDT